MEIKKNIPLSSYTSFKTGGQARFFCEVKTKEDLLTLFRWVKKEKINFFFLGGGSNLLISDSGFNGLIIKVSGNKIIWKDNFSWISAGTTIFKLISEAKKADLGGIEWAFGVPATVGGGARNNMGAFGFELSQFISEIEVFDLKKATFFNLKNQDCQYSYRNSIFQQKPEWLIWRVKIKLLPSKREVIEKNILKYFFLRKEKQPLEFPSAGSFFKNPPISLLDKKIKESLIDDFVNTKINNKEDKEKIREKVYRNGSLPAGYFIEKVGLKGKIIGGAKISLKHANFIINFNKAKTEDIIILASIIKQKVRTTFHIQLKEEVEYVGF